MCLSSQLENRLGGEEKYQERITKHLVPCIAQFSVAMADDSMWKPLNYQILLKTRDSSPKVRTESQSGTLYSPRVLPKCPPGVRMSAQGTERESLALGLHY